MAVQSKKPALLRTQLQTEPAGHLGTSSRPPALRDGSPHSWGMGGCAVLRLCLKACSACCQQSSVALDLHKQLSPSIIAASIGKLLPLPHAQAGHGSRGTLVVHVLHAAVGHLALRHEGLATPRHCRGETKGIHPVSMCKATQPLRELLLPPCMVLNIVDQTYAGAQAGSQMGPKTYPSTWG